MTLRERKASERSAGPESRNIGSTDGSGSPALDTALMMKQGLRSIR